MAHTYVILGNPANRRVQLFQEACRRQDAPTRVVRWSDFLTDGTTLACNAGEVLRIESPGEDDAVERLLLRRGLLVAEDEHGAASVVDEDVLREPLPHGAIVGPRQWFRGFRDALHEVDRNWSGPFMNAPPAILQAFDKSSCQRLLAEAGVPVPTVLGIPTDFDDVVERLTSQSISSAFLKLRTSSSSSGVVALRVRRRRGELNVVATSSAHWDGTTFRNRLHQGRTEDLDDIRRLVDFVCREGAVLERWVPKASLDGGVCDVRVVVVGGEATHVVVRQSSTGPMTNLHLGNRRGDLVQFKERAGDAHQELLTAAEEASRTVGLFYAGVDVALTTSFSRPHVFEVNAMGDLLPGLVDENNDDTYGAQVRHYSLMAM